MVPVFSHWFPANTLVQMVFDLVLLSLILAVGWFFRDHLLSVAVALPCALLLALGMMSVTKLLGGYDRHTHRSVVRTSAVVVLCFLVAAPMAYGMIGRVPRLVAGREELGLALLLAFSFMVAIRSYGVHKVVSPLLLRRVLVLGTGAEAAVVEQSLTRSGPYVRIVGFYPVHADEATHVARDRILTASDSLSEAARRLRVGEIIVAVSDRRTDAVPLRELLDCRLAGVRVRGLSSYFEQALGQLRLDSLRPGWLIFGEGFRQGLRRKIVKRLFDVVAATLLLGVFWPLR